MKDLKIILMIIWAMITIASVVILVANIVDFKSLLAIRITFPLSVIGFFTTIALENSIHD